MGRGQYSFSDYKRIAHQFLSKHGILGGSLPIDIDVLIDKAGITIHSIPAMFDDFGVKGAVLKKPGGYDIAIDETHYEKQEFYYRFTLAEELSHVLIHTQYVANCSCLEDVQKFHSSLTDDEYKVMEQEARALASQLLLPSQLFDPYVLTCVGNNLNEFLKSPAFSKQDLAQDIAQKMYKDLHLSAEVVKWSILRYPDAAIDKVLSKHGQALIQ